MSDPQFFMLTVSILLGLFLAPKIWRCSQRKKLFSQAFPENWSAILNKRLSIYSRLNENLKSQLHQEIQLFLFDKKIVGCEGLEVTEEMKLLIAAQACLLLLNHPTNGYKKLRWIYVYPYSFFNKQQTADESGIVSNQRTNLLGVSWSNGRVILSWDDVEDGLHDFSDGHNVTLHEFAHQLDNESGATNGAPLLSKHNSYKTWARVLSGEFEQLQKESSRGHKTVIDKYGATNPAEFFAVATETFFERPQDMQEEHKELFEQLKNYYQLDPRDWVEK